MKCKVVQHTVDQPTVFVRPPNTTFLAVGSAGQSIVHFARTVQVESMELVPEFDIQYEDIPGSGSRVKQAQWCLNERFAAIRDSNNEFTKVGANQLILFVKDGPRDEEVDGRTVLKMRVAIVCGQVVNPEGPERFDIESDPPWDGSFPLTQPVVAQSVEELRARLLGDL